MEADKSLELARKAFPNNENLRVAYMLGIQKGAEWADETAWKPSIEQLEALWCAVEKYLESDNANVVELRGKVLESLYDDLKKLTGE